MQTQKSSASANSRIIHLHPATISALPEILARPGIENPSRGTFKRHEDANDSGELPTRFLIHTRDEIKVILFDEVVCCVADSNYTHVHLRDGSKVMVSKTLKEVETILSPGFFVRIHASNLINLHFIKRILKTHQYMVELTNQIVLGVSRSRRDGLMQKMEAL